jgi:hypothetical protein
MLTAQYYPTAFRRDLLEHFSVECPRRLSQRARRRQLTEVSWSNIRIQAFPGIEWSRSTREAPIFMSSRIWPSHEALQEVKLRGAEIPDSSTVPWYGISRPARFLRWLFSSPPRVQTLLSVRAALARRIGE